MTTPPEQLLMTAAAHERIRDRLTDADVVTLEIDGSLTRNGAPVTEATLAPTLAWASLDAYPAGQLPRLFQLILAHPVRWCQLFNAGLDNPAFRALMAHGVRLTKSDAQAPAIAEYVLAHALARLHPIAEQRAAQDAHEWRRVEFREVADTRWLIVGFGAIGRAVAERLRPWGAHLTVVRRTPGADPLADAVIGPEALLDQLSHADVIVLAAPLTAETDGLADAAFFAAAKPGALLVNVARGGLVEENALRGALDGPLGRSLGHAVLDVFHVEPLPADHWAWDHPKVTLSAHCSNAGSGQLARGDDLFLDNLARWRAGEPLRNEAARSEVGLSEVGL